MRRRFATAFGLLILLAGGARLHAQGEPPLVGAGAPVEVPVDGLDVGDPSGNTYGAAPGPWAGPQPPKLRKGFFGRIGVCCWATHNTLGCGSLKSECKFIFGSCRTFYSEPCQARPPIDKRPPGYGPIPGRREDRGRDRGCNCPGNQ